jgi:hypothetical protein
MWKRLRSELEDIQDNLGKIRDKMGKIQEDNEYPEKIKDKVNRIHSAIGIDIDELGRLIGVAHKE